MTTYVYVDTSGSTNGKTVYWSQVKTLVETIDKVPSPKKYFVWDSTVRPIPFPELTLNITYMIGDKGTKISEIARSISQEKNIHTLIIITDGQVEQSEVSLSDTHMEKNSNLYDNVSIYLFGTDSEVNLSVPAPFIRKAKKAQVFHNKEIILSTDASTNINLLSCDTPSTFLENYPTLQTSIISRTLGKGDTHLHDDLVRLKDKLLHALTDMAHTSKQTEILNNLRLALTHVTTTSYQDALFLVRSLINDTSMVNAKTMSVDIEKKIQYLLALCKNNTSSVFSLQEMARIRRAPVAQSFTEQNAIIPPPQEEDPSLQYECPISLDKSTPILLIKKTSAPSILDMLLTLHSTGFVDTILNCPLFLLASKDSIGLTKDLIDHTVGLETIQEHPLLISPITRDPILGVLILAPHKDAYKANIWTLSRMFSVQKKLVGHSTLWLFAIYLIIKDHVPWLSTNEPFMHAFKTTLQWYFNTYQTTLSMSGNPEYPSMRVPFSIALWYVPASSDLYANDPQNFIQERLREYAPIAPAFYEASLITNYPINMPLLTRRALYINAYSCIHRHKCDDRRPESTRLQYITFPDKLRSQYQAHIRVVNEVVFLDGPPGAAREAGPPTTTPLPLPLPLQDKLLLPEILFLDSIADPQKKHGDVLIPEPLPLIAPDTKVLYPNYQSKSPSSAHWATEICPATLRPYYDFPKDHETWKEKSIRMYGPIEQQVSVYSYYIKYVNEYNIYPPNPEHFTAFMYKKEKNSTSHPRDTLPSIILQIAQECMDQYALVTKDITPMEFIKITERSVHIAHRIEIEKNI